MRALIIGTGYFGRALKERLEAVGFSVLHTYHQQRVFAESVRFDLFSQNVAQIVDVARVDTVIVASKIEHHEDKTAVMRAMARLFDACREKRLVYVSSDAVFDGRRGRYAECEACTPRTAYGRCKAQCEALLQQSVNNHCVIRSSYIYGYSSGRLDFRLQAAIDAMASNARYARYVDMFKSPVEVNQLASMVEVAAASDFRGVLHACGPRMSVYDFVKEALEAMAMDTRRLEPSYMDKNDSNQELTDTSLDAETIHSHFGFRPLRPTEALQVARLQ